MSHANDDDAVIILSVIISGEAKTGLDKMVEGGAYGSTRDEVVSHYVSRHFHVEPLHGEAFDAEPAAEPDVPTADEDGGTGAVDPE